MKNIVVPYLSLANRIIELKDGAVISDKKTAKKRKS